MTLVPAPFFKSEFQRALGQASHGQTAEHSAALVETPLDMVKELILESQGDG
jgi:hypothetical protein